MHRLQRPWSAFGEPSVTISATPSLCNGPIAGILDRKEEREPRLAARTIRGGALSIPNLITLGRILLVPVVIWAITAGEMSVALALFLLAGVSGAVDGFLAKRVGMGTEVWGLYRPAGGQGDAGLDLHCARGHRGGAALARHPRRLSRHHDRGSGDSGVARAPADTAETAAWLQAQHRRTNCARLRHIGGARIRLEPRGDHLSAHRAGGRLDLSFHRFLCR